METPEHIRNQRAVGGNLALDLLNTQNGPAGGPPEEDVLHDYGALVAWSEHVGGLDPTTADALLRSSQRHPVAARTVFDRVQAIRAYLYDLFDAIARQAPAPPGAIRQLQQDEVEALAHGRLVNIDGGYRWSWGDGGGDPDLALPLWTVVHAASTLLIDGPLDRVKGCASCRFHFLDESRNRSRRWCSMDDCGTQVKMNRYVARRASKRLVDRASRPD